METTKIIDRKTVEYSLDGTSYLVKSTYLSHFVIKKIICYSETHFSDKELLKETKKGLIPITKHALEEVILTGQPVFVLKKNSRLYYAKVTKDFNLGKSLLLKKQHECSCGDTQQTCKRLLSLPDVEGGCSKVRNFSTNIQNFDFITDGYETQNVSYPIFFVSKCKHKC